MIVIIVMVELVAVVVMLGTNTSYKLRHLLECKY